MNCPATKHNRTTYARGACRCPVGRDDRRLYLKRRREGRAPIIRIPALGYQRRLQALIAAGWSYRLIGNEAGMAHQEIRRIIRESKWVSPVVAERLDRVWANLGDDDGPSIRSIKYAKQMDWAPSWAWDGLDIDDPRAKPHRDLPPVIDEVLIQRVMDGKRPYRDLNPDERLAAYRTCIRAGWSPSRIQQTFHISGSVVNGLKKAA